MGFGQDEQRPPSIGFQPLPIRYFNESNQLSSVQGTLKSQEMSIMEYLQGKLFTPAEDFEGNDYAVCSTSQCTGKSFTPVEHGHHIYAATEYNGHLYMAGSSGSTSCTATVWKSTNGGSTWSVARRMYKTNSYPGCARFTLFAVYNNKLYVQGYQYDWSEQNQAPCYPSKPEGDSCNWVAIRQPMPSV